MNERRQLAVAAALLFLGTLALYSPVIDFGWVPIDDNVFVVDNPNINAGFSVEGIRWSLSASHGGNWMPLTWLSHMIDVSIFGLAPGGHHAINALLHSLNCVLLLLWLHSATGALGRSLAAGVFFAVHPLHVESVAWIAERKDVLSTAFGFGALWAYVVFARRRSMRMRLACFVLMAASLASKPTLVTLPFVLLLLDIWPLRRLELSWPLDWSSWRACVTEKLPFFSLALVVSLVTLWSQGAEGAMGWSSDLAASGRIGNALRSIGIYLVQTVWPVGLGAYYPHPYLLPEAVAPPSIAWLVGVGVCLLAATLNAALAGGYLLVGWFWFLGTLVPMLGLVQVGSQAHADRYMYVPLTGLIIAVCWWVPDGMARRFLLMSEGRRTAIATGMTIAATGALLSLTIPQIQTWRSGETMLRRTLVASPRNPQMRYMLSNELWAQGRQDEAMAELRRVLEVRPSFPEAYHRLGLMLEARGQLASAIAYYEEALRQVPGQPIVEEALARARRAARSAASGRSSGAPIDRPSPGPGLPAPR